MERRSLIIGGLLGFLGIERFAADTSSKLKFKADAFSSFDFGEYIPIIRVRYTRPSTCDPNLMRVVDLSGLDISHSIPRTYADTFFNAMLGSQFLIEVWDRDARGRMFTRHRCPPGTNLSWDEYEEVAPGHTRSKHWDCRLARRKIIVRLEEIVAV